MPYVLCPTPYTLQSVSYTLHPVSLWLMAYGLWLQPIALYLISLRLAPVHCILMAAPCILRLGPCILSLMAHDSGATRLSCDAAILRYDSAGGPFRYPTAYPSQIWAAVTGNSISAFPLFSSQPPGYRMQSVRLMGGERSDIEGDKGQMFFYWEVISC